MDLKKVISNPRALGSSEFSFKKHSYIGQCVYCMGRRSAMSLSCCTSESYTTTCYQPTAKVSTNTSLSGA